MAAGNSGVIANANRADRHGTAANEAGVASAETSVFAQRIESARVRRGLTKTALIARAGIGRASLYNLLGSGRKGDPLPSAETLLRLATALMVHPFWLLEGLLSPHATYGQREATRGLRMGFVHDISFSDGALVAPGQRFVKKALVQNLSDFTVRANTIHLRLFHQAIEVHCPRLGTLHNDWLSLEPLQECVLEQDLAPGETMTVEIWFKAPERPGPALAILLVADSAGRPLFNEESLIWVWVRVSPMARETHCVETGEPRLLTRPRGTARVEPDQNPPLPAPDIDRADAGSTSPAAFAQISLSRGIQQSLSSLAQEIDALIRGKGLTVTALARTAQVSRGTLYNLRRLAGPGWRMPRVTKLVALARSFGLPPFWLCEALFHGVCIPLELDAAATGLRPDLQTSDRIQGAMVSPGGGFLQRWTVRNPLPVRAPAGSLQLACLDPEFEIRSRKGVQVHACQVPTPTERIQVIHQALEPGACAEIEVSFSAPKTNGTVFSLWALQDRQGNTVGSFPQLYWTAVRVTEFADNVAFRRK